MAAAECESEMEKEGVDNEDIEAAKSEELKLDKGKHHWRILHFSPLAAVSPGLVLGQTHLPRNGNK